MNRENTFYIRDLVIRWGRKFAQLLLHDPLSIPLVSEKLDSGFLNAAPTPSAVPYSGGLWDMKEIQPQIYSEFWLSSGWDRPIRG